jgi:hypothetical protein
MAERNPNGSDRRRRELALIEVHLIATQLLQDARTLTAGLEAIIAEVNRATEGS